MSSVILYNVSIIAVKISFFKNWKQEKAGSQLLFQVIATSLSCR